MLGQGGKSDDDRLTGNTDAASLNRSLKSCEIFQAVRDLCFQCTVFTMELCLAWCFPNFSFHVLFEVLGPARAPFVARKVVLDLKTVLVITITSSYSSLLETSSNSLYIRKDFSQLSPFISICYFSSISPTNLASLAS